MDSPHPDQKLTLNRRLEAETTFRAQKSIVAELQQRIDSIIRLKALISVFAGNVPDTIDIAIDSNAASKRV